MIDQLKAKGEVGIVLRVTFRLEDILLKAGFKYREPKNCSGQG
jgi:hypothetical protein